MSDIALQPERTVLAWRRTQILLVLVAALALRLWPTQPSSGAAISALALLAALVILIGQSRCYRRATLGIAHQGATSSPLALLCLSLCVTSLATLMLWVVLTNFPNVSLR